jgi:hypothetical protein
VKWLLAVVTLVAGLAATPAVAVAHGGATVTVHSDGHGSVWTTASWADGHAVTEPVEISMTARTGPTTVGPVALRPTGDARATRTYEGTLAAGSWQAVFSIGAPISGTCQAHIPVAAGDDAPPVEVACLISSGAAATTGTATGAATLWILVVVVLVAAVVVLTRKRVRPGRTGSLEADARGER